jgi:hypothetical protein
MRRPWLPSPSIDEQMFGAKRQVPHEGECPGHHCLPLAARHRAGANMAKINFNRDAKFDLQLNQALLNERRLAEIFESQKIDKIELKSESGPEILAIGHLHHAGRFLARTAAR